MSIIKSIKRPLNQFLEQVGILGARKDIIKRLPKNGIGAELGVFLGQFSIDLISITNPKEIHLIDPWFVPEGHYGEWGKNHNGGKLLTNDGAFLQAQARVATVDSNKSASFHRKSDLDALPEFPDHYFDWVYVDALHEYDHVIAELKILDKKMKLDGIIQGHDWCEDPAHPHNEINQAIEEFTKNYNWEITFVDKRHFQWELRRKK
jgi:hypothetical protein